MRRLTALFLSIILILSIVTVYPSIEADAMENKEAVVEFYVSVNGNNFNSGSSKSEPLATLEKAKEKVAAINDEMTSDIVVYLMGGTYFLDETLTFTSEDSGTNGYQVRYEAYKDTSPVISGGIVLDNGWGMHDASKNIYKTTVPRNLDFRQLYINDQKAVRARTGNPGAFDSDSRILGADRLNANGDVIPEWWYNQSNAAAKIQSEGGRVFVKDDGTITSQTGNLDQVELHIFTGWCENILRIKEIEEGVEYDCSSTPHRHYGSPSKEVDWDGDSILVTLQDPETNRVFNRPHPNLDNYTGGPHYAFYYENAYEFIDQDEEWYLDSVKGILYYKAPQGQDMASTTAIVPKLENVVKVSGTLDNPVKNIRFKGITFEHSTWMQASEEGLVGGQACQYVTRATYATNDVAVKGAEAGVLVENAKNIRFDGIVARFMGGTGFELRAGTDSVVLINSTIEDIAGNGISMGQFAVDEDTDYHTVFNPEDKREICTNNKILNNYIRNIGTQYEGAVGIGAGYVQGVTIANNTVSECPYTGISIGFGWSSAANPMQNNTIYRNEVFHVNQIVCDGGAIYTLSNQTPDSSMQENYLHDNLLPEDADYGANGIYLDERTSGYTVSNNVLVSTYSIGQNQTGANKIGTNYIFQGTVPSEQYNTFLTSAVQMIIDNAGVQENYEEYDDQPKIYAIDYEPYYDTAYISGNNLGSQVGSVYIQTTARSKLIPEEDIIQWSENEIRLKIRDGSVGKIRIETHDFKYSNGDVGIRPRAVLSNYLLREDFESAADGELQTGIWDVSVPAKASIQTKNEQKLMELKGNNPNLEVTWLSGDGSSRRFGKNITTFDFQFPSGSSNHDGLYNLLRESGAGTKYTLDIRPSYSPAFAIEQKGQNEEGVDGKSIQAGKWYTCKTMILDDYIYLTAWEKGTDEPEYWDIRKAMADTGANDSLLNFSYYDSEGRSVYIDNIEVVELEITEEVIVSYKAGTGGSIIGTADQRIAKDNGTTTEVTAVADDGYRFKQWSDGKKTAARTDTGLIDDVTFTAQFEKIIKATKITLTPAGKNLKPGESFTIEATVEPIDAANKAVSFASSNSAIAAVSGNKVTAKAVGTVTITATARDGSGVKAAIKVTVKLTAPRSVKAVQTSAKAVRVTWGKVTGAKKYDVYRSEKAASGFRKIGTATANSYKDKRATSGKTWYYKVAAVSTTAGNNSTMSSAVKVSMLKKPSIKVNSFNSGQATVTWNKIKGAKGYQIYISTKKTSGFKKKDTLTKAAKVKSTVKKLESGRKYYFKVRAYKKVNGKKVYGAYSKTRSIEVK